MSLDKFRKELMDAGYVTWTGKELPPRTFLTTYSGKVDSVLGGGLVPGSIVEVSGPHRSGKSTLVASWLKDRDALWVALEYTDPKWIAKFGGNPTFVDPKLGERAWDIVRDAVTKNVPFIVLDSLGQMVPISEDEKDMDEIVRSGPARLITTGLKRTIVRMNQKGPECGSILIMINQVRDLQNAPIPMLVAPGGHARAHFAHVQLEVRRKEVKKRTLQGQKVGVGQTMFIHCVKNKFAPPERECLVYLDYDGTFSDVLPGKGGDDEGD